MDKNKQALNQGENEELNMGQSLYEMENSNPGWKIVKGWLEQMAFHSWVDPREATNKEEWEWRELNAFHAASVAKEIIENIEKAISRSEYLDKVKSGEIDRKRMTL